MDASIIKKKKKCQLSGYKNRMEIKFSNWHLVKWSDLTPTTYNNIIYLYRYALQDTNACTYHIYDL